MSDVILKIENLNIMRQQKQIFKNFSLELKENDLLGILAPSGSGKSTLIDFITENLSDKKETNVSGNLWKKENLKVSVCFQEPRLIESTDAVTNVALPVMNLMNRKFAEIKAEEMLKQLGISYGKSHKVQKMSGGERQRVSLARALCFPSELLLLDEPFKGLDVETKTLAMETVRKNVSEEKKSLILVSHQLEEINFFTDNIITKKDFIGYNF